MVSQKFVAIDFETANEKRGSACALGLVVVNDDRVIEKKYWLIRPRNCSFAGYNTYIHGISESDVRDKDELNTLWPEILPYLENSNIVAHNMSFDCSVLKASLAEYSIPYPSSNLYCSRLIAKKVWPQLTSYSLKSLANYLEISFQHHYALDDADVAAKIVMYALQKYKASSLDELIENINLHKGLLSHTEYSPCRNISKDAKYKVSDIKAENTNFDPYHPAYEKLFVFTGALESMTRKEAMQHIVNHGGYCGSGITKKTNFLVMGNQDFSRFVDGDKSSKTKKAEQMTLEGKDIEIISEEDFLGML